MIVSYRPAQTDYCISSLKPAEMRFLAALGMFTAKQLTEGSVLFRDVLPDLEHKVTLLLSIAEGYVLNGPEDKKKF